MWMAPTEAVQDITRRAVCDALKQPLINTIESWHQVWEIEVIRSGVPAVLWVLFVVAFIRAF